MNNLKQRNQSDDFVTFVDEKVKLLRSKLLTELVLRQKLDYQEEKLDFQETLNQIYPSLSEDQKKSVAMILKKHSEINLLSNENLALLDKKFLTENKLIPNEQLNRLANFLGKTLSYVGLSMVMLSPTYPNLFVSGTILTGVGFGTSFVVKNNLERLSVINNGYEILSVYQDKEDKSFIKAYSVEKNANEKVKPIEEKSNLDKNNHMGI